MPRRTFKQILADYTRGWFPAVFGSLLVFTLVTAAVQLFSSDLPDPWGEYTTPVYIGQVNEAGLVSRFVGDDGIPVVTEQQLSVVVVRCGPAQTLDLVSNRFWFVVSDDGDTSRIVGRRVPFTFEPPDTASGCEIRETTAVTIPDDVAAIAEGRLLSFRSDVVAANGRFLPVIARSEQFRYMPDADMAEFSRSVFPIETP